MSPSTLAVSALVLGLRTVSARRQAQIQVEENEDLPSALIQETQTVQIGEVRREARPTAVAGYLDATTFHWNSHRPCATTKPACIAAAQKRLGEMAKEMDAQIVGAVEMKDAHLALPGWQATATQCDGNSIIVAEGWRILQSGGMCIAHNDGEKGLAFALVEPPEPVQACPQLCVVVGHMPHPNQQFDKCDREIGKVCGAAAQSCLIAMGDWNREDISFAWERLSQIPATLVEPRAKTCCFPEYRNAFDHTATNIAGAISEGSKMYSPQLTHFPSVMEHKPVSVQLKLPLAALVV